MLVTITEYQELAKDANGNTLPLGNGAGVLQSRTADGDFTALAGGTQIIRIATDTAVTLGGELFMPGVEYKSVSGGETLTLATV